MRSSVMRSSERLPLAALEHGTPFADRHVGPRPEELSRMLDVIGVGSLEELAQRVLPPGLLDPRAVPELSLIHI